MKHLLPLVILTNCLVTQGVLEWTVIGKVTDYGQNVTLFCNVSNCCPKDAGWDMWTPEQRTLYIDVKTGRSNKKYDGKIMKDGYTLVIQNLTEQDLNVSYSCLYDVTLGTQKFLLEEDVFTYISTTPPNDSTGNSTVLEGQIAGIIVGIAVVGVAVCLFVFRLRKQKTYNNNADEKISLVKDKSSTKKDEIISLVEDKSSTKKDENISLVEDKSSTKKGYFLKYPSNIECFEGDEAIIICEVRSNSPPVKLKKGNNDLAENDNYEISSDGEKQQLKLKRPKPDDSGEYFVHVGESFRKVQLNIKEICMDSTEKSEYINKIASGREVRHYVRIQVVGKGQVGKTSLVRNLLEQEIGDVKSTDGLEIVRECRIKKSDGEWIVGKVNEKQERIKRINMIVQSDNIPEKSKQTVSNQTLSSERYLLETEKNSELHPFKEPLQRTNSEEEEEGQAHERDLNVVSKNGMMENTSNNAPSFENPDIQTIKIANLTEENRISSVMSPENKESSKVINIDTDMIIDKMEEILKDAKRERQTTSPEDFVECGIWDFAGQKDYYATHQTFFTPHAIYLLVANIEDAMKEMMNTKKDTDHNSIGKYIDFWFDSIHCFCEDKTKDILCPPVFMVFTGIDEANQFDEEMKNQFEGEFRRSFKNRIGNHMRGIFFISNTRLAETDKDEINRLKATISSVAKEMNYFEEMLSTEWIQLEHALCVLKDSDTNILSWKNVQDLSDKFLIKEKENLLVFLNNQHKIGNIIFFEDIKEYIILNPNVLVQCFRCLVCDPGRLNLQSIPVSEYNKLTNTGELSDTILKELFKKEPALAGLETFLPNVMEKFDIIVKPKLNNSNNREYQKSETYYLPCMITNAFDLECIIEENFKVQSSHRTPWLVLEFEFLPVVYFNHILFNYIRTYTVCKEASGHPAIHSGKAVVYLDNSESRLLIICFSKNAISLQICSETKLIYNDANDKAYKLILEKLCVNIEELERKLMHSLSYKIKAKCGTGDNFKSEGRISFNELSREYEEHPGQYRCKEHKIWHDKEDMETTWLKHAPAIEKNRESKQKEKKNKIEEKSSNEIQIPKIITENNSPAKCHYCEKMPVYRCYECSNVLCNDCCINHDKLTDTEYHTFQSTNDKMLLNNKFEVSNEITDMKALPGGLLVIAVCRGDKLLTYSVSDKQRNEISVGGLTNSIAILDRNTVVVMLQRYDNSMAIVDIRQRQVIQRVDVRLYLPFGYLPYSYIPMFYTDDQLYIRSLSGIAVTDMSGTKEDRKIDLGFRPTDMCCDTKAARIYCIDDSGKKLICIDRNGNTIFTITDSGISNARRLTIDNEGYVLILCYGDYNVQNFTVYRISPDGKSGEVIITGKQNNTFTGHFSSICFQEESDEVVIGIEKTVYTYKKKREN